MLIVPPHSPTPQAPPSNRGARWNQWYVSPLGGRFTAGLLVLAGGCSDTPSRDRTLPPEETSATPGCSGSLEQGLRIFPCPATYTAATDGPQEICRDFPASYSASTRQAHSFIIYLFASGESDCIYDSNSSVLVGMFVSNDGGSPFCAGDQGEGDRPETLTPVSCRDQ